MRIAFVSLLIAFLTFTHGTVADAETNIFTVNLSLGSRGTQVTTLQQILNRDESTRVASTGPGSPGNETGYFGSLTKVAVVRFQEKYASEVLAPAWLSLGTGYVGFYTRAKLNALSESIASGVSTNIQVVPSIVTLTATSSIDVTFSTSTIDSKNPNLRNLDKFLAAIDKVAAKQKIQAVTLAAIKEQVIRDVATTTDLRATFLKIVQNNSHQSIVDTSFAGKMLAIIEQAFGTVFMPERARATAYTPFGGALIYSYFCNCSSTWLIDIEPLPPTYVVLLTYEIESQAYPSYNIPDTNWLLGEYWAGVGVCWFVTSHSCGSIPSEGMITPMVGSSLL